jgi:2-dehydropantoate 2-reductase
MEKLHILSFGAGAIGTYIGGSLALQGHRVVFLERPEVAALLRQRGLRLGLNGAEEEIPSPVMASTLEEALKAGPFDTALFALKSFDTAAALEEITPFAQEMPAVLSLQNGVENEAAIAAVLGPGKVLSGTVTSAIGRRGAGDIVLERLRGVGLGANHALSQPLAEAFNEAGLNARLYAHAAEMKWSKMLTNLLANATSAILNMTPAQIFDHPGLYKLELAQLREALQVMDAQHIRAVDLPGTPVRALAFAVRTLPASVSRPLLKNAVGGGRGGKMPSFHIDLYAGRGLSEVDYLNGAVVRFGRQLNIPTPVNQLLNETLLALTSGEIPLDAYAQNPNKLIGKIV